MPIDKDLKRAFSVLYDERNPSTALQLYDAILKDYPGNLIATIYKAAALEKLYYGFSDWHNDQTLESAKQLLADALKSAQARGDRGKLGLVYFRHFIHYFNNKDYGEANVFMNKAKEYDYKDDTLPMWEAQLERKLKKKSKKPLQKAASTEADTAVSEVTKLQLSSNPVKVEDKLRTDWYQTSSDVVLSLFTPRLPQSEKEVAAQIKAFDRKTLEVSFQIPESGSEFQYSIKLAHEVDPENVKVKVFTRKLEIVFKKKHSGQWKSLSQEVSSHSQPSTIDSNVSSTEAPLNYPSSSKKQVDWSKIDLDDDNEDDGNSADAFFQKLYADADPDTKRAMMKSFVESNGTALNTNWEDVSKKKVDASPPEGMEIRDW